LTLHKKISLTIADIGSNIKLQTSNIEP